MEFLNVALDMYYLDHLSRIDFGLASSAELPHFVLRVIATLGFCYFQEDRIEQLAY
jgi:hypothetical protein